jgi:hypothetical protein
VTLDTMPFEAFLDGLYELRFGIKPNGKPTGRVTSENRTCPECKLRQRASLRSGNLSQFCLECKGRRATLNARTRKNFVSCFDCSGPTDNTKRCAACNRLFLNAKHRAIRRAA